MSYKRKGEEKMTFDKYKGKISGGWGNVVFPSDGYLYHYKWNKKIGWHQVRGKKIEDLKKRKWSIGIAREK